MSLILHHYDFSNFSEKIRLILGFKRLAWQSVEIPSHLPKPDYTPLTGGYRRTPALQIGADVFCDTWLITHEIEQRFPLPTIYGQRSTERNRALIRGLASWGEGALLWSTALYITGVHADKFPLEFHKDRASLHHKPEPSVEQVQRAGRNYYAEMCAHLARIEALLDADHPFILGAEPTLADFMLYGAPWLLEMIGGRSKEIDELPNTRAWMERVAATGHGDPQPLDTDAALRTARDNTPQRLARSVTDPPAHVAIGDPVFVSPRDEHSPAAGVLAHIDAERIVIESTNDRVGTVHVHFPRVGYRISKANRPA